MRVLHFLPVYVPAWQYGGPILSVSRLCEGLIRQGVDIRVITTNAGLPDFPTDQLGFPQNVNGVEVTYYPVDHNAGVIRSKALVKSLPVHMSWAELLHLSSIWQPLGVPIQKAAHAAGVPVIQTPRGALGPYSWRRGLWKKVPYFLLKERPLLQRAAALHCTTTQEVTELDWLSPKSPTLTLPNPVDLTQLSCMPGIGKDWRNSNGIPSDQPLFLVSGRMHHKKGLDLLPHALKALTHIPWHILFIGQDSDGTTPRLRRAFEQNGLIDRSTWLPSLPAAELIGPYNAADWLLLPSRHENFGNVVIEALACGCGALVSDKVGVGHMLVGTPGFYMDVRDPDKWTQMLLRALSSTRPGKLSESFVKSNFSQSLISQKAHYIYQRVLSHA